MPEISVQPKIDFRLILEAASNLQLSELEVITREFNALLASKKAKSKDNRIKELYELINSSVLSDDQQEAFNLLYQKLLNDTITDDEKKRFEQLTEQEAELRNLRVAYMVELSQIRQIPFPKLMIELGLKPLPNV